MEGVRAAIPPGERARRSDLIEQRLFRLPELDRARTVALFYSFGTEVATRGMAERVWSSRRRLVLPYLEEGDMHAAEVAPGDVLVPSSYGAREPPRRPPLDPSEIDVVVTPGLAFDRRGNRLGYGGGHYDRFLGRLAAGTLGIGVAFGEQVVDEVPAGPDDRPVHLVVTDAETVDCRDG
jgi:5-formyltetrahydrofolate cyclo-ligase